MRSSAKSLNKVLNIVRSNDAHHSCQHPSSPTLYLDFRTVKLVKTDSSQTQIAHRGKTFSKETFSLFKEFSASGR